MNITESHNSRLTRVYLDLDRLSHNMTLLQQLVGDKPLWPCIKANAYGHGAEIIATHLQQLGYAKFCVADVGEAAALIDSGLSATFIVLSAMLPEHSEAIIAYGCEPVVCKPEMVKLLAQDAEKAGKRVSVHLMVDTGMGRLGIRPEEAPGFLEYCLSYQAIKVFGIMSHFPCADQADKTFSEQQIETFIQLSKVCKAYGIAMRHMANSAALFDLPKSYFDAARPGIAIYGLPPSADIINPRVNELKPVLEWKSRIIFIKEVPAGTGLSYGLDYTTPRPSLIATIPVGYGDGLSRSLSNKMDFLVGGIRCQQVGRITMDMSLVDVTALRGKVKPGDEVVMIGIQDNEQIIADELANKLGTINYEIVTCISHRVPRIIVTK